MNKKPTSEGFLKKAQELAAKYGPDLNNPERGPYEGDEEPVWDDDDGGENVDPSPKATTPQVDLVARKQARAKAYSAQRDLQELIKSVTDSWAQNNPSAAKHLKISAAVKVVPRRTGSTNTYDRIIDRILTIEGALSTQTAIVQYVQKTDSSTTPSKDWGKSLATWATDRLKKKVANAPPPFNKIRVIRSTTLRSLHRSARTLASQHAQDRVQFNATITVTKDYVIINGRQWRISAPAKAGRRIIVTEQALLQLAP